MVSCLNVVPDGGGKGPGRGRKGGEGKMIPWVLEFLAEPLDWWLCRLPAIQALRLPGLGSDPARLVSNWAARNKLLCFTVAQFLHLKMGLIIETAFWGGSEGPSSLV
jgi:hypothetical protein